MLVGDRGMSVVGARSACLVVLILAACAETSPPDSSQGGGGDAASECTGTCSTHFEGSTSWMDLCGLQGALTNREGTLFCDDGSSCSTLDDLHKCMNDTCQDVCQPTPPTNPSVDCRSCLETTCGDELAACVADAP